MDNRLNKSFPVISSRDLNLNPLFSAHPQWLAAIKQLLEMGVRAQQQALAKWELNYVIDDYLPCKLEDRDSFFTLTPEPDKSGR
jgi:DNA topoisomerase VI subunit A